MYINSYTAPYCQNHYQTPFQAEFRENATVKKKFLGRIYKDEKASIVEMDKTSEKDKDALSEVSYNWVDSDNTQKNYTDTIYYEFVRAGETTDDEQKRQFFALTSQKSNFKEMKHDKVLGLAEISQVSKDQYKGLDTDAYMLEFLQAKPDSAYAISGRKYKKVGKSMLDFIIKNYTSKPLLVSPIESAEKFYSDNGFEFLPNSDTMIYTGKKD